MLDVAIIGAGLAGLTCASELQNKGLTVELFDKSRGVGGRLATRRLHNTRADHGLASWSVQGVHTAALTTKLQQAQLLKSWTITHIDSEHSLDCNSSHLTDKVYVSTQGITVIAKYLSQNLSVHRCHRLIAIQAEQDYWQLHFEQGKTVKTNALILAIPFPQALPLLQAFIPEKCLPVLTQLDYSPALSLMLGYESLSDLNLSWQELQLTQHPVLHRVIYDGCKRSPPTPSLVIQTNASFASQYLDSTNLDQAVQIVLKQIRSSFNLPEAQWWQVHRWRYAQPKTVLGQPCLNLGRQRPLIACGDWCLGKGIEGAIASGFAAARELSH